MNRVPLFSPVSDFNFSALTPNLLLNALESLDIIADSGLLALNSYENRVYQFTSRDHGRLVAKFYRPSRWSNEQIVEEHKFSIALQNEELPIVAPMIINGQSLHEYEGYRFALFPSVGGRQFEVDNIDQLEWMGRLIGRIHQQSSRETFQHRHTLNQQSHLFSPRVRLDESSLVPDHLKAPFFAILELVIEETAQQYAATDVIRLHGDCHPGNILWRDGPIFVDLDDCCMGPAIQDLWMMLSGDRQTQLFQLDVLVNAYEEFHTINPSELALIEPLRAMRMVHYMAWLANRWQDPAFPTAFPWFGEDKYWEQQILSLKEQLSALREEPLKLFP